MTVDSGRSVGDSTVDALTVIVVSDDSKSAIAASDGANGGR